MKCTECNEPLTDKMLSHAKDKYTPDHKGLCCDCFDVSCGGQVRVKLNRRTPVRLHDFDDYEF